MNTTFRTRLIATGLAAACAAGLASAGASSASADPAPPATSHPDVTFVVPNSLLSASTDIAIGGVIRDGMTTDSLNSFSVTMTCADGGSVGPAVFYGNQVFPTSLQEAFQFVVPATEQGKTCTLHSTGPANRVLNFTDTPAWAVGDEGDVGLSFAGTVIEKVTHRGSQY